MYGNLQNDYIINNVFDIQFQDNIFGIDTVRMNQYK